MRWIGAASDVVRRLVRPPRVVALTRHPAGWFAVGRRRLHDVVAWARYEDGDVVGLVASRRGLRPAVGRAWRGYLPAIPHSSSDVQLSPPAVVAPVADLEAAVRSVADPWSPDGQAVIYARLREAASVEWASRALAEYAWDPERFLRNHFALIAEHWRPAELDVEFAAGLASITKPPAPAGMHEEKRP